MIAIYCYLQEDVELCLYFVCSDVGAMCAKVYAELANRTEVVRYLNNDVDEVVTALALVHNWVAVLDAIAVAGLALIEQVTSDESEASRKRMRMLLMILTAMMGLAMTSFELGGGIGGGGGGGDGGLR